MRPAKQAVVTEADKKCVRDFIKTLDREELEAQGVWWWTQMLELGDEADMRRTVMRRMDKGLRRHERKRQRHLRTIDTLQFENQIMANLLLEKGVRMERDHFGITYVIPCAPTLWDRLALALDHVRGWFR